MTRHNVAPVDQALLGALNNNQATVPLEWAGRLAPEDESVFRIALGALQTARNQTVAGMHVTLARELGLPKPTLGVMALAPASTAKAESGDVIEHFNRLADTRGVVTLAGLVALAECMRGVRGDQATVAKLNKGRALGLLSGSSKHSDMYLLRARAQSLTGVQSENSRVFRPELYTMALQYAMTLSQGIKGGLAVGLLSSAEQAYDELAGSRRVAKWVGPIKYARATAYAAARGAIRKDFDEILRRTNLLHPDERASLQREVGLTVFYELGKRMHKLLSPPGQESQQ